MVKYDDPRNDEELLLAARVGDDAAQTALVERYFAKRFMLCRVASPNSCMNLNEWDLNEAFFHAILQAITSFQFRGVRFSTFFKCVLEKELIHMSMERVKESGIVSLDASVYEEDGESIALCDSIPTESELENPHSYLLYLDRLNDLGRLPADFPPVAVEVVKSVLSGAKMSEVCQSLGISVNQGKYFLAKYRSQARKSEESLQKFNKKKKKN